MEESLCFDSKIDATAPRLRYGEGRLPTPRMIVWVGKCNGSAVGIRPIHFATALTSHRVRDENSGAIQFIQPHEFSWGHRIPPHTHTTAEPLHLAPAPTDFMGNQHIR